MFIGVQDVAVVPENEIGDRRNYASTVRAADQEYGRLLHRETSYCFETPCLSVADFTTGGLDGYGLRNHSLAHPPP